VNDEQESSLPAVMVEIAQAAGMEAAWAIVRAHGGTTVYFPRNAVEGHWLTELVGIAAARKICRHFGVANTGMRVLIPLARQGQQQERLVKALEAGMSATAAATAAGMHERSAFRARKRLKEGGKLKPRRKPVDDRQQELF